MREVKISYDDSVVQLLDANTRTMPDDSSNPVQTRIKNIKNVILKGQIPHKAILNLQIGPKLVDRSISLDKINTYTTNRSGCLPNIYQRPKRQFHHLAGFFLLEL